MRKKGFAGVLSAVVFLTSCSVFYDESASSQSAEREPIGDIRSAVTEGGGYDCGRVHIKYVSVSSAESFPELSITVGGKEGLDFRSLVNKLLPDCKSINNDSCYVHTPWQEVPEDMDESEWTQPAATTEDDDFDLYPPRSPFFDIDSFFSDSEDEPWLSAVYFHDGSLHGSRTGSGLYPDEFSAYLGNDGYTSQRSYYPTYEDISGVSCKMADGTEWALSDAVEFTEKLWNDTLSAADRAPLHYYVERVDIIPLGSDRAGYYFFINLADSDGRRFDCEDFEETDIHDRRILGGERLLVCSAQYSYSFLKEKACVFSKGFSFRAEPSGDSGDDVISLEQACGVLSDTLGGNMELSFDTAELSYMITCDNYPDDRTEGKMHYDRYYLEHSSKLCARPYWVFKSSLRGAFENWRNAVNYYVDAHTGELIMIRSDG